MDKHGLDPRAGLLPPEGPAPRAGFSAFLRREFVYGSVFYSFLLLLLSIPSLGIVGKVRDALFGCETPMP